MHDIVYVYVRDSSSSNVGVLLRVVDKLYPVTQRQHVLLHLLLSHFPFARGWKPQEMTSQVVGKSACYTWPSYVRGYREYKKRLVSNCRRNTEANNGTYQSPRPLCRGSDLIRLCSGTRFEDSQPNRVLFRREGRERRLL